MARAAASARPARTGRPAASAVRSPPSIGREARGAPRPTRCTTTARRDSPSRRRGRAARRGPRAPARRPARLAPMVLAEGPYPTRWIRGSRTARVPSTRMPPPGSRSRSGARWSMAARKPVAHRMTSASTVAAVVPGHAARSDPVEHRQPVEHARPAGPPDRVGQRQSGHLTTLCGGSPRRTRSSTRRRPPGPGPRRTGPSRKTGGRRVTQVVSAAALGRSPSDAGCRRRRRPPRSPAARRTPPARVVRGVQLAPAEGLLARVARPERPVPGARGIDQRPRRLRAPSEVSTSSRPSSPSRTARHLDGPVHPQIEGALVGVEVLADHLGRTAGRRRRRSVPCRAARASRAPCRTSATASGTARRRPGRGSGRARRSPGPARRPARRR